MSVELEQIGAVGVASAGTELAGQSLQFATLARDVATMGGGTALAVLFNTSLVFLIPRLISIEDFGYWRLFLLYTGYAGFLHLGFADGALLRWAGRRLEEFRHEVKPSMKFLLWQNLALVVTGSLGIALALPRHVLFVGLGVLIFAFIINAVTLLQNCLQSARLFGPVAVATAAPAGGFLAVTFLLNLRKTPDFRELIIIYCVSWLGVLLYLWIRVGPKRGASPISGWSLGKEFTLVGWPILLANESFLLVQSADRLVVSSVLPIREFAEYSLAASTMFVPLTVATTVYRVFFCHVAGVEQESRARVYARASKFLLLLWSLLLPYYFVLEVFVRRFLPKYAPSLPIAGILLMGVIFLADIVILHMSYFYLHSRQRQFLFQAIVALVLSVSVALAMALWVRSLAAVAIGQVVALAFWWLVNEWSLRKTSGQGWRDWLRVLSVAGWSAASYGLVLQLTPYVAWRAAAYYLLVAFVLWFSCSDEFRLGWRLLQASVVSLT
jgi:O-antigen/teichoic acid export membrane protein